MKWTILFISVLTSNYHLSQSQNSFLWKAFMLIDLCKIRMVKTISWNKLFFRGIFHLCHINNNSHEAINTLRPRQNGRHFAEHIFKCIFLNENVWISIKILLKFVPKGPINNILALVQIMARRGTGDKPLSEPMMFRLLTHICVTRPQWVKPSVDLV